MVAMILLTFFLAVPAAHAADIGTPATETTIPRISHVDPFPHLPATTMTVAGKRRLPVTGQQLALEPVAGGLLAIGGLLIALGRTREP